MRVNSKQPIYLFDINQKNVIGKVNLTLSQNVIVTKSLENQSDQVGNLL